jgi:F0F1-type ATP synthase membrane subunit b/b'
MNFGSWESGMSQSSSKIQCHGHLHIYPSPYVLKLGYSFLKGRHNQLNDYLTLNRRELEKSRVIFLQVPSVSRDIADLKKSFSSLEENLKKGQKDFKKDIKKEMKSDLDEFKKDIKKEMKSDLDEFKKEFKKEMKTELDNLKKDITNTLLNTLNSWHQNVESSGSSKRKDAPGDDSSSKKPRM